MQGLELYENRGMPAEMVGKGKRAFQIENQRKHAQGIKVNQQ
jgi:hypothetical protein